MITDWESYGSRHKTHKVLSDSFNKDFSCFIPSENNIQQTAALNHCGIFVWRKYLDLYSHMSCVCFKINWQLSFLIPSCCCHVKFFCKLPREQQYCTLVICSVCVPSAMSCRHWREGWVIRACERLFCHPEELLLHASEVMTFTFMHLADAFIQSDLHCIQVTVSTFYQILLSLGIEPMILALLTPCSTSWATGKLSWIANEGKRLIKLSKRKQVVVQQIPFTFPRCLLVAGFGVCKIFIYNFKWTMLPG